MALIKSISGIRGTIGGRAGENFTPEDVVACTAAFGYWLKGRNALPKVVVGRDARISGKMISSLVANTLVSLGFEVIDLGLSTTPTVEIAVVEEVAGAGIIITASHNPKEWNALKFLNEKGEFISRKDGETLLALLETGAIIYSGVDQLGSYRKLGGYMEKHVDKILALPLVKSGLVKGKNFKIVLDPVNSSGSVAVPILLEQMGCEVIVINAEPWGEFAHNPEPLPENLLALSAAVVNHQADVGIAVDPDVDRLALVCADGRMFGEEYTLVAVADYILQHKSGNTVSNLSSTRALRDVTLKHGGKYYASAVGEVNVVSKMKEVDAVIGGEGNGGVIVPDLHYGRDALAGIALLLSYIAASGKSLAVLKQLYPHYFMVKDKIALSSEIDTSQLLEGLFQKFSKEKRNTIDGLKIDFEKGWVHMRKSNTEPIIRIYAESTSEEDALAMVDMIKKAMEDVSSARIRRPI